MWSDLARVTIPLPSVLGGLEDGRGQSSDLAVNINGKLTLFQQWILGTAPDGHGEGKKDPGKAEEIKDGVLGGVFNILSSGSFPK